MRARLPISASRFSSDFAPALTPITTIAPAGRERVQVLGQVGGADELEDHVEGAVLGEALGRDRLGAERRDLRAQLLAAHGRRHARPGGPGELDRGGADTAGASVHEQMLAGAQPRL